MRSKTTDLTFYQSRGSIRMRTKTNLTLTNLTTKTSVFSTKKTNGKTGAAVPIRSAVRKGPKTKPQDDTRTRPTSTRPTGTIPIRTTGTLRLRRPNCIAASPTQRDPGKSVRNVDPPLMEDRFRLRKVSLLQTASPAELRPVLAFHPQLWLDSRSLG